MDDETFESAPQTIRELRYLKDPQWGVMSPRDQLVSLLRKIDSGEIAPTDLYLAYFEEIDGQTLTTTLGGACRDARSAWALLARASFNAHSVE